MSLVQQQFGPNAQAYVHSAVHAQGQSLQRLVELAAPQPYWLALDVAPGGGHSALAVAGQVQQVIALDVTHAMLLAARDYGAGLGLHNVHWVQGDGGRLPLPDDCFDLVTCRVALHHFPDQAAAIRDWARTLRPGGRLVLVDNISPDDPAAAAYVNAFEKLRDPSHGWLHTMDALVTFFSQAGLHILHQERLNKPMNFQQWMDRMAVATEDQERLTAMLWSSPASVRLFLDPQGSGAGTTFSLHEGIILAEKAPTSNLSF